MLRALPTLLFALFPASFRHEYEDEMREVYSARLREGRRLGPLARWRLWARVHFDLLHSGLHARTAAWSHRRPRSTREGQTMLDSILADLRSGVRVVRKNPGFAAIAIATLAVGIGASTALFSLARATLLQSLPVPEPSRVVRLFGNHRTFSYPNFEDLRRSSRSFEHLAVQRQVPAVLGTTGEGRAFGAELVSAEYFQVFGVAPILGRTLEARDFDEAERAVVIGQRLWRQDLGGRANVVGAQVELNRHRFTVVGVMPDSFAGSYPAFRTEVWAPVVLHEQLRPLGLPLSRRGWGWLTGTGRLADGVSLEQARAEVATIGERLEQEYPDSNRGESFDLMPATPLPEDMRSAARGLLGVLALIVSLILVAVCANAGGVLLGRAMERNREIAVRVSMGASRWRLMRLLFAEATVIAAAGGTLGVVVALVTGRLVVDGLGAIDGMQSFDPAMALGPAGVGFAYALALAAALLFGLLPALRTARGDALGGLRGNPSLPGGVRSRSWSALVVAQVAIAVVLLAGAGLLLRSVRRAEAFDPGFRTQGIALASVNLTPFGYDGPRTAVFLQAVRDRLAALPGATSATWATSVPLGGDRDQLGFEIPGHRGPQDQSAISIPVATVGPDYFETLEIPILAGRGFVLEDFDISGPRAVVVNRTFAESYFGGDGAVGRAIGMPDGPGRLPIVGVVADSKVYSLGEEPHPFVYLPGGSSSVTFFATTDGDARALLGPVRQALADQDAQVLPRQLLTFAEARSSSLLLQRALGTLTGLLAGLALVLTALGVYGSVSFGVTRRRRELGVRMALGAWPASVIRLVLARAGWLVAIGLVLGVAGGMFAGQAMSRLLFGTSPFDPTTFVTAALLIATAAAAASYFPARRALQVDPLEALRPE